MRQDIFALPIWVVDLPEDQVKLIQAELEPTVKEKIDTGALAKNPDWKANDTFRVSDPSFGGNVIDSNHVEFFSAISHNVLGYMISVNANPIKTQEWRIHTSWLTLSKKGEYAQQHKHGCYDISGCYYYAANEDSGSLFFVPPVRMSGVSWAFDSVPEMMSVRPKVGRLIMFPSWLEHGTSPNANDEDRISLAFNIEFTRNHPNDRR